ncbi:transcriptional regulator, LacI family [Beutenbergia cavernae DSM 12333]|uniref:Transcriptional regulator, LacI family n=1 Tax=Beutenbergia cavernae (strain ATCC BAA-8 / DSM 12333 / CCUG 43141 / JCM 11478 / NBRC 16432 / NCIMB 13614 / HKI 0122) TaxID=471853 RepID=C5C1W3_BEUC1|nr:LacI family DNA-binding transcriptional regulator [Beutenbergia cavernae]ACQ79581.1 transcriptional regulator, LacI family [Beutenbergia cavernae DSM 12333]
MATIGDVARVAGVSTSTVSYVLSGKRPISGSTRERVERAIRDLGYRPHAGARALASARTNVLGLMAPLRADVNVSVIMQFVTGVVTAARNHDRDVLLLTSDEVAGTERVANGSMVDALIMMDVESDDARIDVLVGLRQPAVLIGLPQDPQGLSCVDLDFDAAGRLAVRHLTALGHRRVALIGSPQLVLDRHTSYAIRLRHGFAEQADAAGLTHLSVPCSSTPAGAADAVDAVLEAMPDVTALVVHNEVALPWVLTTLAERGRRVPQEISVVAVCPRDVALGQRLPLTSIDIPGYAIGQVAVEMAMARLAEPGTDRPAETRLLTPTLEARESTTAPT